MGYDMYHEHQPAAELAAYDQARAEFDEALAKRKPFERGTPEWTEAQRTVDVAYDKMNRARSYYFRLNLGGMSKYLEAMDYLGMIDWEATPPLPREWSAIDWDADEAKAEQYAESLRTRTSHAPRGMPGYKFNSNDGWLVAPGEVKAALAHYVHPDDPQFFIERDIEEDYWNEWIQFLLNAVDRGGFRVY
jgi:hypothetical protein